MPESDTYFDPWGYNLHVLKPVESGKYSFGIFVRHDSYCQFSSSLRQLAFILANTATSSGCKRFVAFGGSIQRYTLFTLASSIVSKLKWDARLSPNNYLLQLGVFFCMYCKKHFSNHKWKVLESNQPDFVAKYTESCTFPFVHPQYRFLAL